MSIEIKITDFQKLYIFDTLHDFWKERKTKTNNNEDDDDAPDESKKDFIRNFLLNFLYSKYFNESPSFTVKNSPVFGKYINELLSNLTGNYVTSVTSDYERTVEEYYELKSTDKDY